jgi:hypothetical protein
MKTLLLCFNIAWSSIVACGCDCEVDGINPTLIENKNVDLLKHRNNINYYLVNDKRHTTFTSFIKLNFTRKSYFFEEQKWITGRTLSSPPQNRISERLHAIELKFFAHIGAWQPYIERTFQPYISSFVGPRAILVLILYAFWGLSHPQRNSIIVRDKLNYFYFILKKTLGISDARGPFFDFSSFFNLKIQGVS